MSCIDTSGKPINIGITYVIIGDTIPNESITIRFAEEDLKQIDKKIKEGKFTSRSDFIRYAVRHNLFELNKLETNLDILADIAEEKKISMKDIRKSVRKTRRKVHREVYGND